MKASKIHAHSLDRYKKARAIISEGASVTAACKKARIAVGHYYQIRHQLKQRRRRTNGHAHIVINPPLNPNPDIATAIDRLQTRRDEADAAIRVLKSL